MAHELAVAAPSFFTPEQEHMIRDSFLSGASREEAAVLLELARLRRLNPIAKQIHFVKRWDQEKQREVWSSQVGIDGFRVIAERTGQYDGQDEPAFEYDKNGRPSVCRVKVFRKGIGRPFVGRADFSEYAQFKQKDGSLTKMWATKPHIMLAKCAEALAFRKAFPEDLSGLYAPEEMGTEEREVNPPPTVETDDRRERLKAQLREKFPTVVASWDESMMPSPYNAAVQIGAELGKGRDEVGRRLRALGRQGTKEVTEEDVIALVNQLSSEEPKADVKP